MPDFTTGPSLLPDVGTLDYNGCVFSPLFETKLTGNAVKDNAQRTVKLMEYTLTADGYVTLIAGATNIAATVTNMRRLLTSQGGSLTYSGRGFSLSINGGNIFGIAGSVTDVAWGPVPELLEFQPLGGGLSAKVQWKVTVRVPEIVGGDLGHGLRFLQLNYETGVTYAEDGYSTLSIRGTMEIPLTRTPSQSTRTLTTTVDEFRNQLSTRILTGIDLSRFRVTRREFNVSRDKRTMEWNFEVEEKPYMDLPPDCTVARGTFNVRPARAGPGLVNWLCTLKATYTVRADVARRIAWVRFLALLRLRMLASQDPAAIRALNGNQNPAAPAAPAAPINLAGAVFPLLGLAQLGVGLPGFGVFAPLQAAQAQVANAGAQEGGGRKTWLVDFSFDEGLYLDSKTVSFSATWRLVVIFSHILLASGLWKKVPERDAGGGNFWAASMADIQGTQSWLPDQLDPALDIIVDFGSTTL
jgi:hypothetical protein